MGGAGLNITNIVRNMLHPVTYAASAAETLRRSIMLLSGISGQAAIGPPTLCQTCGSCRRRRSCRAPVQPESARRIKESCAQDQMRDRKQFVQPRGFA